MAPEPATRTTRHQLAKAQAGQYSYNSSELFGSRDCSVVSQKLREIDFITLFGGRSTGSNRARKCSTSSRDLSYGHKTNVSVSLAKTVLSKPHHEMNGDATNETSFEATENADANTDPVVEENRGSHTPVGSPIKTLEEVERLYGLEEAAAQTDEVGEDSFVQQITCFIYGLIDWIIHKVSVTLCCFNIGVPQHLGYDRQGVAFGDRIACIGVTQVMHAHIIDSC